MDRARREKEEGERKWEGGKEGAGGRKGGSLREGRRWCDYYNFSIVIEALNYASIIMQCSCVTINACRHNMVQL